MVSSLVKYPPGRSKYFSHPLVKDHVIEARLYQLNIAQMIAAQNSLVVLPTSLGKTIIALLAAVKIWEENPQAKVIFLAPTRPLVLQHYETFQNLLNPRIKCCLFSSNLSSMKRTVALNDHHIFFTTPQIIQNDLRNDLYSLKGVSLIIFDEAHKARKKYAYTFVAQSYLDSCAHPIILGITASPGKDLFRINELCETLQIEQVILREPDSPDVAPYTHAIETIIKRVELPDPILKAQLVLDTALRKIHNFLLQHQALPKRNFTSKFQFIQLIQDLKQLEIIFDPYTYPVDEISEERQEMIAELNFPHLYDLYEGHATHKPFNSSAITSRAIEGIYLEHLKEILTTQDVRMFHSYLRKLETRAAAGNKRVNRLLHSKHILGAKDLVQSVGSSPKIPVLQEILQKELELDPDGKFIIFTQYREMGQFLTTTLNTLSILKAQRFVGQASKENDKGLKQKEQSKLARAFSSGDFNVLVATSVAEEGLDLPNVTAVIFYDSVPSEIRLIQRRGRTGRHSDGRCYCLVTPNTLDEIYHRVSHRKEEKMHELLRTPGLIATVPDLPRSVSKPRFQSQSLQQITAKISSRKAHHVEQILDEVTQIPSQTSFKGSTQYASLVNDYTKQLTAFGIGRLEKKRSVPKKHTTRAKNTSERAFHTKKIFDWIFTTIKILGTEVKTGFYCNLDDLYQAAREEELDLRKIEIEITHGKKTGQLQIKHNYLYYFRP
ncbi:MAG: DEAD/DEAH box helicase [Promethearchaeota archaeon]